MKSVTTTTATSLLFLALIQAAMCANNGTVDVATFFPQINGNLTKIVWAHAVNNKSKLEKVLDTADIMMLEADVTIAANSTTPIMAHPPANSSDLTLEEFLDKVIAKNVSKGIKLDFKSIEAFNASKPILDRVRSNIKFPVFLNADILAGPGNATVVPVNAESFLTEAKTYPEYTLSVGWTTRYDAKDNITEARYTEKQIQEMIDTVKRQKITQPITYPVRAGLAANDIQVIKSLLEKSSEMKNATLTVWSSEGDKVDPEKLSQLIREVGVNKVFVDVPQDLLNKLRYSGASSVSVASVVITVTFITAFLSTIL
ncbi:protein FAM151B isoform X1 [Frieseomelitta varia]|uniref:protein FAM151B isoform X1 n=2 Tax=Frieseomelitta varia TaxID=561572 RepID=UPI001CB6936B|nr:protein FAM151B isoform X1 [Frieseomelitta varia]